MFDSNTYFLQVRVQAKIASSAYTVSFFSSFAQEQEDIGIRQLVQSKRITQVVINHDFIMC